MSGGCNLLYLSRTVRLLIGSLQATTNEPLLFLYPRWYCDVAAHPSEFSRHAAPDQSAHEGTKQSRLYSRSHLPRLGRVRRIPSSSYKPAPSASRHGYDRDLITTRAGLEGHTKSDIALEDENGQENARSGPHHTVPRSSRQSSTADKDAGQTSLPLQAEAVSVPENYHHGKRSNRIVMGRATYKANKSFINRQKRFRNPLSEDWRAPLEELKKHTEQGGITFREYSKRILVPEGLVSNLVGDVSGETIWHVKIRSGCQIHILERDISLIDKRALDLCGSASSIEMAEEIIAGIMSSEDPSTVADGLNTVPFRHSNKGERNASPSISAIRAVWARRTEVKPQLRADKIPRPEIWTVKGFADYVDDLCGSHVSRLRHRQLYPAGETHVRLIRRIIRKLFLETYYEDFVSIRAFNAALTFLYKHMMVPTARMLFVKMESLKLEMVPETFNIMLRGAAGSKDLVNFTFVLRLMIKRGFRPNGGTWAALLMALESKEVQWHILEHMEAMNLLHDRGTMKDIVALIIPGNFLIHLGAGKDVQAYISGLDTRFGRAWLSVSAANSMLSALGQRGFLTQALVLLDVMCSRDILPNVVSLNALLTLCLDDKMEGMAFQLVQWFDDQHGIEPDEDTYDILFKLAWRSRSYNVCRTVWWYACLDGAASFKMQKTVKKSLQGYSSTLVVTEVTMWKITAGKVIAGIELSKSNCSSSDAAISLLQPDSQVGMSHGIDWAQMRHSGKEIIRNDLAAAQRYKSLRPFPYMLGEALALDRRWTTENMWSRASLSWKLEHAIKIHLVDLGMTRSSVQAKFLRLRSDKTELYRDRSTADYREK
ncbi:MAG: hypothetical protein M1827_004166 [Pycnora praestabilis]|nr:MAG: hypothetical protein M1827_004166 [Pycnora praestabilis]